MGKTMTVYGTAKKPAAPTPKISAGTAINVYAVYRSPPSKNQVMTVPNPRPPRPHSFRCSRLSARRQRAAAKPIQVTSANKITKTLNVTGFTPLMSALLRPGRDLPLGQRRWFLGPGGAARTGLGGAARTCLVGPAERGSGSPGRGQAGCGSGRRRGAPLGSLAELVSKPGHQGHHGY